MSNRLSFCIFFSSFCVIVFFLQPSRILYYIIIMCVHFTYQFVRVDVCVCARARGAPFVSFQLFFPFCTLLSFYSAFTHRRRALARTHARTSVHDCHQCVHINCTRTRTSRTYIHLSRTIII